MSNMVFPVGKQSNHIGHDIEMEGLEFIPFEVSVRAFLSLL